MVFLFEKRLLQQVKIYLTSADMSSDRFGSPRQIHVQPHLWIDFVRINTASDLPTGNCSAADAGEQNTHLAIFNLQIFVSF